MQYFAIRHRARRQEKFFNIRQLSFANKASLKVEMSLRPNPPNFFGLAIRFQEIHDILRLSVDVSHQNLVRRDWISAQIVNGNLKLDMACEGIAERTVLNIIILPAFDRKFVVQLIDFLLIMSTMLANRFLLLLPNCYGNPR